jgi:hypothetical protein
MMRGRVKVRNDRRVKGPQHQGGAEVVEFLITLPVILIVLAIFVDFGFAYWEQAILTHASRAAALEVIRGGSDAEAQQASDRFICRDTTLNDSHLMLYPYPPCDPEHLPRITVVRSGSDPGDQVRVSVSYDFHFLLLPSFLSSFTNINLTATAVMNMLPT